MPSVRSQGRAPDQSFWKGAPPLLVLVIYIAGAAAVALIGGLYAPEFIRVAPPLLPLSQLISGASPSFAYGLDVVAALALLLLPLQILDAMINRTSPPNGSLFPASDDEVSVEEVSSSQPIVAWRVWSLRGEILRGAVEDWLDRVKEATCPVCVEVPGVPCICGIYAVKEAADLPGLGNLTKTAIRGRVELSGIVIEHELGYRAQRARILELWAPDFWTAAALERRYGCLVHTVK